MILEDYNMSMSDLIVFGEDFGPHPSSTQHLVKRLSTDRRVLWVNAISGLRRSRFNAHNPRHALSKAAGMLPTPSGSPKNADFSVFSPRALPLPGQRWLRKLNGQLLAGQLRRAMQNQGMRKPLLWVSSPSAVDVVGNLGERACVYYCGDDFSALEGVDHACVAAMEAELSERADLILAASPALAAKFPAAKTRLAPHGVDVDLFSRPAPRARDLPEGAPIIGFYGALSAWFDWALLGEAARRLPSWQFVLVGPLLAAPGLNLRQFPNIHCLGQRPHEALPGYVQHWDVSILPLRDTPQTRACNPLKLREYLAAGTPVVSTDFPALDGYRDLARVASTSGAFTAALIDAVVEGRARAAERQACVADESWEARARQIEQWLDTLGEAKSIDKA
jgi:hypothetical protein